MKILYIMPSPPNSLGRYRSLNILETFKNLEYEITLAVLYKNDKEKAELQKCDFADKIISVKQSRIQSYFFCLMGLLTPFPLRVMYCHNKKLQKKIAYELESTKYDFIYVKRLRMAQFVRKIKNINIPVLIDITDSMTKYYQRIYKKEKGLMKLLSFEEYIKHKYYEIKVCKESKNIVICSEIDKKYIAKLCPEAESHIQVLKNTINVDIWKRDEIIISPKGKRTKIVFWGIMDYKPNVIAIEYFMSKIFPMLDDSYSLTIIGPNMDKLSQEFTSTRVKFLGYVDDIVTEIAKYDIFICPILAGAGVKNKVIQASMLGLPIVTTTMGIEGIEEVIENHVFIADSPEKFAESINEINTMEEEVLYDRIYKQREYIGENYDCINNIKKLLERTDIKCPKE